MDEGYPFYEQGALVWDDEGTLIAAGMADEVKGEHDDVNWRDLGGRLVMPGLVCAHGHFYGFLARGISLKDEPPENFPQILERLWVAIGQGSRPRDRRILGPRRPHRLYSWRNDDIYRSPCQSLCSRGLS